MTIHAPDIDRDPTEAEAQAALNLLRRYAETGQDARAGLYPALSASFPDHVVDDAYRATLPDLQNGPASLIRGADRRIQHVGISNFRLPLQVATRDGARSVDASVTGTVSLEAGRKGINMSRIMRSFYAHAARSVGFDVVEAALDDYLADLGSFDARLLLRYSLPLQVNSLRSGLIGWQYYDVAMEVTQTGQTRRRILHVDYVYSSTCPCSLELSEHARRTRGQLATPHSQRSVARLSVEVTSDVTVEDVIDMCRAQVPTETQVMVKREDEQAFAELNAANPIFVEDAARLFAEGLERLDGVADFRIVASHQESLHSHDAVSVLTHGDLFAADTLEPRLFGTLIHGG
ncbi:GTP cyclohydrolase FolE2 [Jannaschia rubra]|uniref:GTP cyclohydrolase folE2 n=1 Tax=Jannaschia rubra TaxID=282197 RepID=A0A0M6XMN5_9RHOB|nr:GTP cyclohydrolase FolE2 [Jannaschia rubra]CTQ32339.1 GTP cyclohydrolase folE2 [Jannaschia rubra]SFG46756.1 GTP cyclohydrolase I [Jannaschia rubra]